MVGNEFPSKKVLDCLEQVSISQSAGREAGAVGGDLGWSASHFSFDGLGRGGVWGACGWRAVYLSRVNASEKIGAVAVCHRRERKGMWNLDYGPALDSRLWTLDTLRLGLRLFFRTDGKS